MLHDDERARREAVRAFGLVAATLANPVPKLMADLAAPEERLRGLDQEPPLASFSPFGTLPDDIAYHRGEPAHPPAEAARTPNHFAGRETTRSDAGRDVPPSGAKETPSPPSPEARPPVFSFRKGGPTLTPDARRDRRAPEGPVNTDRRHSYASGTANEDQGTSVNAAFQRPSATEHPGTIREDRNENPAPGALFLADSMSLLDDLAEDALGVIEAQMRNVSLHPGDVTPESSRYPEPLTRGGEVAVTPASAGERLDITGTARLGSPAGFGEAWPDGGSGDALLGPLVEDLSSQPARTFDGSRGPAPYAPVASDLSTFAALHRAFDEPEAVPSGAERAGNRMPERTSEQHVDPEAFADIINDVLVRQARRHGVDLS